MQNKIRPIFQDQWLSKIRAMQVEKIDLQAIWIKQRASILVAIVFLVFLGFVQFATPDMPDNDGYYHIKLAYLMRTEGLTPEFSWLPLSILNAREYYDHHFLFHVALIPFTYGDLRVGAKLAAVIFAGLALLSVWRVLKNQRIPHAFYWALALMAISEAFIYRMSITRAQSLSLVVLMLALDWLLRNKIKRLAGLAFFYVWLYNAFPLLLIVAGVFVAAKWILERKLDLRPLVSVGAGTFLGLIINPYFPYNIIFAVQHILPKLFEPTSVSVGSEWYPYTTAQLLENSLLALVAFVSGALALGLQDKRIDLRTLVSFLLAGVFGLMMFQSRRFIEYFPPFALVFAAFAWTPIMSLAKIRLRSLSIQLASLIMILILVPGIWLTFQASRTSLQASKPYQTYADASAWLAQHTPEGARVFQTDWDDFPRLFFYSTQNTYLIGLDPTYMQLYDAELYALWEEITQGDVEQPSSQILGDFGAEYVITDLRHRDFIRQAENDPALVERYRDEYAVVYQVVVDKKSGSD